jgi:hypothetical protein
MIATSGTWDFKGRPGELSRGELAQLNGLQARMLRSDMARSAEGMALSTGPGGMRSALLLDEGFPAKITGGSQPYSWIRQVPDANGASVTDDGGTDLDGTTTRNPAYELNGRTDVAAGTIVWMEPWYYSPGTDEQNYAFIQPTAPAGSTAFHGVHVSGNTTFTQISDVNLTITFQDWNTDGYVSGNNFVLPGTDYWDYGVFVELQSLTGAVGTKIKADVFFGPGSKQATQTFWAELNLSPGNAPLYFGANATGMGGTISPPEIRFYSINGNYSGTASVAWWANRNRS